MTEGPSASDTNMGALVAKTSPRREPVETSIPLHEYAKLAEQVQELTRALTTLKSDAERPPTKPLVNSQLVGTVPVT